MKKSTTIFDFFKRKVSHDLEANTSGVTLPTTNVEKNLDVIIEENLEVPIEENPDEPVEENLDVPIEENLDVPIEQIYTYHVDQQDEFQRHHVVEDKFFTPHDFISLATRTNPHHVNIILDFGKISFKAQKSPYSHKKASKPMVQAHGTSSHFLAQDPSS